MEDLQLGELGRNQVSPGFSGINVQVIWDSTMCLTNFSCLFVEHVIGLLKYQWWYVSLICHSTTVTTKSNIIFDPPLHSIKTSKFVDFENLQLINQWIYNNLNLKTKVIHKLCKTLEARLLSFHYCSSICLQYSLQWQKFECPKAWIRFCKIKYDKMGKTRYFSNKF